MTDLDGQERERVPRCLGFGEFDRRKVGDALGCPNLANTPARLWCERCEGLRRAHLNEQFAEVNAGFER